MISNVRWALWGCDNEVKSNYGMGHTPRLFGTKKKILKTRRTHIRPRASGLNTLGPRTLSPSHLKSQGPNISLGRLPLVTNGPLRDASTSLKTILVLCSKIKNWAFLYAMHAMLQLGLCTFVQPPIFLLPPVLACCQRRINPTLRNVRQGKKNDIIMIIIHITLKSKIPI